MTTLPGTCLFFNPCSAAAVKSNRWKRIIIFGRRKYSSAPASRGSALLKNGTPAIRPTGGFLIAPAPKPCSVALGLKSSIIRKRKYSFVAGRKTKRVRTRSTLQRKRRNHDRSGDVLE